MRFLVVSIISVMLLMTAACGKGKTGTDKAVKKIGIVLSIGGLGDKSFNDSAFRGLENAKKDLGIEFSYVEPQSPSEDEQYLRKYAEGKYDLVIAVGFLMKDACEKVAKEFPDTKFAIIDSVIELPNVASIVFKEEEGSFLVGALAAMMSKTGTIGFVGGIDVPLIRKFLVGYEQGALYVNKNIKVKSLFVGGQNPFSDPVKGKESAVSLIKQKADVVYHAAGGTGLGVIEGAKEQKVFAIGVDSDQDYIAEGTVLTSMMKYVDNAVYATVKDIINGTFTGGVHSLGLKEDGVGTTAFTYTKTAIGETNIQKLEQIKKDIIDGKIVVKDK